MILFSILIVLNIEFSYLTVALNTINGRYTKAIINYEVILPRKVKENGAFHSFSLPHYYSEHLRNKRNIDAEHKLYYKLYLNGGQQYHIELWPSTTLLSPRMIIEDRHAGKNVTSMEMSAPTKHLCHYSGKVRGMDDSNVAMSLCSGITGFIKVLNSTYFIEPLLDEEPDKSGEHLHVIYKRSLLHNERHCDSRGDWWNAWAEEIYMAKERSVTNTDLNFVRVNKRSDKSVPRYIEVMVVADKKFIKHRKNISLEEYILTIMNMVASYYHDASIGILIDLVVVRIIYLRKQENEMDLELSTNAPATLESFCQWQYPLNPKQVSHPNHHDLAILITRYDICASEEASCSLLGLAYIGTVCNPKRNCAITEDNGLPLAVTIAHEIGHNMGCAHDSEDISGCKDIFPDGTNSIMASMISTHVSAWSSCSREFISNLVESELGDCLFDEPQEHSYIKEPMLAGTVYDADQQCKFSFGDDYIKCPILGDCQCEKLWCKKIGGRSCVSLDEPMADGTVCGKDKWCFEKRCIEIGERPNAVNGGWSEWGRWQDCSRTCGGGVRIRRRLCNNPQPQRNGMYCVGQKREIEMCNVQNCEPNAKRFREVQCEEYNNKSFMGRKFQWAASRAPESDPNPCALYCINDENLLVKLGQRVKDGTRCTPGKKDTCIQGACVTVGCDWRIGSQAVEDVCGICDGDGTHCLIAENIYKNPDGSGYVEIFEIPSGSVNIKVKELKASENMLAAGGPKGGQYFNAGYRESLCGEYTIGGVIGFYTKPEKNREELYIRGPILENVKIYYTFFKKENPGVEYSYAIPSSTKVYEPKYQWEFTDWGKCSANCGGGVQTSKPSCIEERDGKVKSSLCPAQTKPEPLTRICNKRPCKTHWKVWKWGPCTGCIYKAGERNRRVHCVMENPAPDSGQDGDEIIVEDAECCGEPPRRTELCNSSKPCKSNADKKKKKRRCLNTDFRKLLHKLSDLEKLRAYIKCSAKQKNSSELISTEQPKLVINGVVEDHLNICDLKVLALNLTGIDRKNTVNMSELQFEAVGDRDPIYIPEDKTEMYTGEDAIDVMKILVKSEPGVRRSTMRTTKKFPFLKKVSTTRKYIHRTSEIKY